MQYSKCLVVILVFVFSIKHAISSSCGSKARPFGFIKAGEVSSENEWPWIVSLIHVPTGDFFCAANLIKPKIVLTAAHCIQQKHSDNKLNSDEIEIQLGRFNLNVSEPRSKNFRPIEIIVHPDWNPRDDRYLADLALLVTDENMESLYARPVCLSETSNYNIEGTVVGWGFSGDSEIDHEMKLRKVQVVKVSDKDCFLRSWRLGKISSETTFCVTGVNDGAGPCRGDSGGGFFVEANGIWFMHGIVSAAITAQNCPETKHSITTNIDSFHDWIEQEAALVVNKSRSSAEIATKGPNFLDTTYGGFFIPPDQQENKQDRFDWELSKAVMTGSKEENVIMSPVFVKVLLTLLAEAAGQTVGSETRTELEQVLPYNKNLFDAREYFKKVLNSLTTKSDAFDVKFGSKVYADQDVQVNQRFNAIAEHNYLTDIENIDFSNSQQSAVRINDDVKTSTNGMIKSLVSEDEVKDSKVLLISSVFFKGTLRLGFNKIAFGDFHVAQGQTLRKTFMERTGRYYYYESKLLNARILRLPYEGRRFSMFIILPNETSDLDHVIDLISSDTVKNEVWHMDEVETRVVLPKFRIESSVNLNEVVKQLGIKEVFKTTATLLLLARGGRSDGKLKVSNIIQTSGLHVDKLIGIESINSPQSENHLKEFIVNRPFFFYIEDDTTGAKLLTGRINNPKFL